MHETALIQYTLDAVERQAMQLRIRQVKSIKIVVGDLRGALPDLMQHGFRILTAKRPLFHGTVLEIEHREVVLKCRQCRQEYRVREFHDVSCPCCGTQEYTIARGNELYIDSFEGE